MKLTIHWSAGAYEPNWLDEESYHVGIILDPETGIVVPKKFNNYTDSLSHTWHDNTDNVGISLISMLDANPYNFGICPMTWPMIAEMILTAAEICKIKRIDLKNVLTHAEAAIRDGYGPFSGDPQTKFDLAILQPVKCWDKKTAESDSKKTGNYLRGEIKKYLSRIKVVRKFHFEDMDKIN